MLLKLKAIAGDRNARQTLVMEQIRKAGFGVPQKRENQPIVKPARIAWIELFDLLRN